EDVGEQDEFLPFVVAFLPRRGEEGNRPLPFGDGGLGFPDERVQVPDQAAQQFAQPQVRRLREAVDDRVGRGFLGEVGGHGRQVKSPGARSATSDTCPRWCSLSGLRMDLIVWIRPSAMSRANTLTTRSSAS